MTRTLQLLLCLALAGLIAWAAARLPKAAGAGDVQAMADIQAIGARPHPIGSAELARVQGYLVQRLQQMGLQTQVWRGRGFQQTVLPRSTFVEGGQVQDIVAVLPGVSRSDPALLVMAHYDTVANSPGAADDSVGVAVALQIAGRLRAGPTPRRDVIFLLTDGEEAGLLGARAFFADHPLASRVGAAINLEAEGGGAPAYMFETGPANGALIPLFARAASRANASSLSGFVYSLLPNDTDFSVPKARGIAGMNFALVGRTFDYHAGSAVPANVDPAAVRQMAGMAAPAALALAAAPSLPAKAPDLVYGDVLGWPVLAYPTWAGWLVLAACAALGLIGLLPAVRREGLRVGGFAAGAAAPLLAATVFAALAMAVREATGIPHDFLQVRPLLARFGLFEAALAACALAALALSVRLLAWRRTAPWSAQAGGYALVLALAVAAQAIAPLTAHILAWPLLAAGQIAVVLPRRLDGRVGWLRAILLALPLAQLVHLGHAFALTLGADLPQAPALVVLAALPLLAPLVWPGEPAWPLGRIGLAALVLAAAIAAVLRLGDPYGARYPRPTDIRYVADLNSGRFWRTSATATDPWSLAAVKADGGSVRQIDLEPFLGRVSAAPAQPALLARPEARAARLPDGRLRLELRPSDPSAELRLRLQGPGLGEVTVDGRPIRLSAGAQRLDVAWNSPAGLVVTARAAGPLKAHYADIRLAWPADARPLPPRPAGLMPWGRSDSTVQLGSVAPP